MPEDSLERSSRADSTSASSNPVQPLSFAVLRRTISDNFAVLFSLSFSIVAIGGIAKSSGSGCLPDFAADSNNFEVTWNSSIRTV